MAGSLWPLAKSSLAYARAARASAVSRGASVPAPTVSAVCILASAAAIASRARSDLLAAAGVAIAKVMALEATSDAKIVLRNMVGLLPMANASAVGADVPHGVEIERLTPGCVSAEPFGCAASGAPPGRPPTIR